MHYKEFVILNMLFCYLCMLINENMETYHLLLHVILFYIELNKYI